MTERRPWWASEPGTRTVEDDPDPLTRHRRARVGDHAPDPDDPTAGARDPQGPREGPRADRRDPDARDGDERDATGVPPGWWAPAAEAVARLSEDLAATATANASQARGRAPWEHDADPEPRPAWSDGGASRGRPAGGAGPGGAAPAGDETDAAAHLDVCGICPVCVGLRALGAHRPELVGHLAEAARHLAAAVRTVVDGLERDPDADAADPGSPTRIDLDDLDDGPGAAPPTGVADGWVPLDEDDRRG